MSKKLIAVAAAAALALTGLVATPASATTITGVVIDAQASTSVSHGTKTANAVEPASAMTSRTLDYFSSSSTSRNVVRFVVTTSAAAAWTVKSSEGVKVSATLTDSAGTALAYTAGGTDLSGSTVDSDKTFTFYAYSTSPTAGTVVIETTGSKLTYFVKGKAGAAYNIVDAKFPTSVVKGESAADATAVISYKLTDVFGNEITTGTAPTLTALGATASASTYSTVRKVWEAVVWGATGDNVAMNLSLTTTDLSTSGWAKPVTVAFGTASAGSLATQVTTLTAQVTALRATVAALTADYNKLANRFNKLQAAKKAPKKKVALK